MKMILTKCHWIKLSLEKLKHEKLHELILHCKILLWYYYNFFFLTPTTFIFALHYLDRKNVKDKFVIKQSEIYCSNRDFVWGGSHSRYICLTAIVCYDNMLRMPFFFVPDRGTFIMALNFMHAVKCFIAKNLLVLINFLFFLYY